MSINYQYEENNQSWRRTIYRQNADEPVLENISGGASDVSTLISYMEMRGFSNGGAQGGRFTGGILAQGSGVSASSGGETTPTSALMNGQPTENKPLLIQAEEILASPATSDIVTAVGSGAKVLGSSVKVYPNDLSPSARVKTPFGTSINTGLKVAKAIKVTTNVLKVGGAVLGGVGLVTTLYRGGTNKITKKEAFVDGLFGFLSFCPPFGTAASFIYFTTKAIYEYKTGKTLFKKPK